MLDLSSDYLSESSYDLLEKLIYKSPKQHRITVGEKVPVGISKDLYNRCKRFIEEHGGFATVEEFIEFLLSEALKEGESAIFGLTKEEEEKVKERLRALGYI